MGIDDRARIKLMAIFFKQFNGTACGCPEGCAEKIPLNIRIGFSRPYLSTHYTSHDSTGNGGYIINEGSIFHGYQPTSPRLVFSVYNNDTQQYDTIVSHTWQGFIESWNTATADRQPYVDPADNDPGLYHISTQATDSIVGGSPFYGDPFDIANTGGWAKDFYAVYDVTLDVKYLTGKNIIEGRFTIDGDPFGGAYSFLRTYEAKVLVIGYGQYISNAVELVARGTQYNADTYTISEHLIDNIDGGVCDYAATLCATTNDIVAEEFTGDSIGCSVDPNKYYPPCYPGNSSAVMETSGTLTIFTGV